MASANGPRESSRIGIPIPRLTWKGLAWFFIILFALSQAVVVVRSEIIDLKPVQILAHRTAPESPYICFVAVKGDTKILEMDCLDLTLTDLDRLTEINGPVQPDGG